MKKSNKRKNNSYKSSNHSDISVPESLKQQRIRIILGIAITLFSIFLFCVMVGFLFSGGIDQSIADTSIWKIITHPQIKADNPGGWFGASIADLLINHWFGISSFIFCYLLFICSFKLAGGKISHFRKKIFVGIVLILWISLFLGFISESIVYWFSCDTGYLFLGGGHGYFVSIWLNAIIGRIGTTLFLLLTFITILFFGFENTFYKCVAYIKTYIRKKEAKAILVTTPQTSTENSEEFIAPITNKEEVTNEKKLHEIEIEQTHEFELSESNADLFTPEIKEECIEEEAEEIDLPIITPTSPKKEQNLSITITPTEQEEMVKKNLPDEEYDPTLDLSHYRYPSLDLLTEHAFGNSKVTQEELEANKNKIVETLRNYKIEIVRIKATIGPTVTLYEIVPAPGIKISRIKSLEDDIALALSALGVRIIAPIPGAGTIGIEVPNRNPEVVSMKSIIASKKFQESSYALPIALGRTISNETYTFDLTKMPHLLVAGATGQGKSVGLNAIITSLLYKKHPSQLKFVMIDPKKVELSIYSVIEKHFLAKLPDEKEAIITETSKVINTLNSLCIEMDQRYDLLKAAQVRNLKEYNEKFIKRQLNPNHGHKYLPYIVVVIDEFADLIMTAGKEVETPIARIAQLARAIGIHMIIATQRPSTNIITGVIKANFPARIAFKVASMIDSRTILDSPGANQLIGRGDMLISVGSEMIRVQCAFVDTPEVDAITQHIAQQQSYPTAFALPEYLSDNDSIGLPEIDANSRDPLFNEAARLVVSSQQGSTSSIQRRFRIGYNRAGSIMDQLEAAGIVGPFEGSKARQVLVQDEYNLEQILNRP